MPGLLLPATLDQHLGLRGVVKEHVDLGDPPGWADVGQKATSLIHSMLAGGDSIEDTNLLRAGATQGVLDHAGLAPSTLGSFLHSFTMGHVRELHAVGREKLRRAWEGDRGPGDRALPIDMDSTICEAFGLLNQGVGFGYTQVRGYHPLLATRADTGEVLPSRQQDGSTFTARGATGFLAETLFQGASCWHLRVRPLLPSPTPLGPNLGPLVPGHGHPRSPWMPSRCRLSILHLAHQG